MRLTLRAAYGRMSIVDCVGHVNLKHRRLRGGVFFVGGRRDVDTRL